MDRDWDSCLINELRKLKESSKEAVENIDEFSRFKQYMHVHRPVESQLTTLIRRAKASPKRQLVLVCGGVGDGKSHLLSHLRRRQELEGFRLHNDATESFSPQKTSLETLNERLNAFCDENIDSPGDEKFILAINLGALANFIDSSYAHSYQRLKAYVEEKRILNATSFETNEFDENSSIQFINFTDYHMFTLTSDGVNPAYIMEILDKVVQQSDVSPFHKAYSDTCQTTCPLQDCCPVRANFDFLRLPNVRQSVAEILVEAMIKRKLLVSTRELLNFVFYVLVPNHLDQLSFGEFWSTVSESNVQTYISWLMPTLLYEHPGVSHVNDTLSKLDPTAVRLPEIDQISIAMHTRIDLAEIFIKNVQTDCFSLLDKSLQDGQVRGDSPHESFVENLTSFFLRLYRLSPRSDIIPSTDHLYEEFVQHLYWWNTQDKSKLKKLYDSVKEAIYAWGGTVGADFLKVNLGKSQTKFRTFEHLPLISDTSSITPSNICELEHFLLSLELTFKDQLSDTRHRISIDFPLYKLLMEIREGYRPNRNDRNNFLSFVRFIDELSLPGHKQKEIWFEDNAKQKYKLTYDEGFEEYTFGEITS